MTFSEENGAASTEEAAQVSQPKEVAKRKKSDGYFDTISEGGSLVPDAEEMRRYIDVLFRYADAGTFASARAFNDDATVFEIRAVELSDDDDRATLLKIALAIAARAAAAPKRPVFCPPVATFKAPRGARETDLANGLVLSIELDKNPRAALEKLARVIGPPTLVAASGGEWMNPETGEIEPKLHAYWRLNEPTRWPEDHAQLKRLRALATAYTGADASNVPLVHPIRWAGSWHLKSAPRLCRAEQVNPDAEIDLTEALELLEDVAKLPPPLLPPLEDVADREGLVRGVLSGENYHEANVRLAASLVGGGLHPGGAVRHLRDLMNASDQTRDERWQARYDDIPRAVSSAQRKYGQPDALAGPALPPALIDPAAWDGIVAPPREWAVKGIMPWLQCSYLTGVGSVGKSLASQQIATCVAVGLPFLGVETRQAVAIYVTCEDDADELHRRQKAICEALGVSLSDLSGNLHLLSLAGEIANEMATFAQEGNMIVGKAYERLEATAAEVGAQFIVLDNVAHLFAGNENIRAQVAAFVSLMNRLAQKIGGAVLLLGHPNKAGQEFSGSTAWENQVRSRLYMGFVTDNDGVVLDSDARTLTNSKANYGPARSQISFRWHKWAFVHEEDLPTDQRAELAAAIAVAGENAAFLACLRQRAKEGDARAVGPSPGPNYAPAQFSGMALAKGFKKPALKRAMDRLFSLGKIEVVTVRNVAKSRDVSVIREVPELPERLPEPAPNTDPERPLSPARTTPHTHSIYKYISGAAHEAAAPFQEGAVIFADDDELDADGDVIGWND